MTGEVFGQGPPEWWTEFMPNSASNGEAWYTWHKPRGCAFVFMFLIGGGGGGSGGTSSGGTGAATGGGGGASGAVLRAVFPAIVVPDTLFVSVGYGGRGGAAGADGNLGAHTYVSVSPVVTANQLYGIARASTATAATRTAAQGVSTVTAAADALHLNLGVWLSVAGQAGGNGGSAAAGTAITPGNGVCNTGGAGGGGSTASADRAGGNVSAGYGPVITGGAAGSAAGRGGVFLRNPQQPFYGTGGSGGGSFRTSTAFAGGPGALGGSGGGGGGGGNVGGRGGDGGGGYCLIACY